MIIIDPSSEYLKAAKANREKIKILQDYEARCIASRGTNGSVHAQFGPANLPAKLRELIK